MDISEKKIKIYKTPPFSEYITKSVFFYFFLFKIFSNIKLHKFTRMNIKHISPATLGELMLEI